MELGPGDVRALKEFLGLLQDSPDVPGDKVHIFFFLLITPFLLCSIVADFFKLTIPKNRAKVERKITGKTEKSTKRLSDVEKRGCSYKGTALLQKIT